MRRDDRVVEGACLENMWAIVFPGFESRSLRHERKKDMKIYDAGRICQGIILVIGSIMLLINNALAGSMIGIIASSCFIIANAFGLGLYVQKNHKPEKENDN